MESRKYQEVLSERGRRQNLIVCLPTGSGKTLIAVNIMNSPEFRKPVIMNIKKHVFLVHTLELAHQQAAFIRKQTDFRVLVCTSDSTGSWPTAARLKAEFESHHVLVMIAQIFYDKLLENILSFRRVAVLVVDECHNATKHHSMNEVMGLYHRYVEENPFSERPRIIGLTATINKTKMKKLTEEEMMKEVVALETRMDATAQTSEDLNEVDKFSTSSKIITLDYNSDAKESWGNLLEGVVNIYNLIDNQSTQRNGVMDSMMDTSDIYLKNFSRSCVYSTQSNSVQSELKRVIKDFHEIYTGLGPLGVFLILDLKIDWLRRMQGKLDDVKSPDSLNIDALRTQFILLQIRLSKMLKKETSLCTPTSALMKFVSHKVEVLLKALCSYRNSEDTDNALIGLVFVKRRSCAVALKTVIEEFGKAEPSVFGFLKAQIITGTNNIRKDASEVRVSSLRQKRTLEEFRNGRVNLIVCTTVLEEGVDVPSCNLVVRFDEIHGYSSFIQSMGRARKRGAKFLALAPESKKVFAESQLSNFLVQQRMTSTVLQNRSRDPEISSFMSQLLIESDDDEDDDIDDLLPFGPNGPKITAASAIPLVYQYIQKDKSRNILSWWGNVVPPRDMCTKTFQAYVLITGSPLFNKVVEGPLAVSSYQAKRTVFMKVAKMLCEGGAVDEHLYPV